MFKKLCILLIFSKLKVTKLFNRQISYAQLSVHDVHYLTYIIHSGFISGYQNRYGDNLKPPTNVYHRMTA